MIDVEQALREELDELTSPVPPPDWEAVLARAAAPPPIPRRRAGLAVALVAALAVLWIATPLGAAIANGVGGFSSWLSGEPGAPAGASEQQAFDRANARSFQGFPRGTKLRELDTLVDPVSGARVDLLGFRSGDTLCLRTIVSGNTRTGTQACAPLAALRQSNAPVHVVLVDQGFGKGTKHAWYGLDRRIAPALQVTAGIVADGVRSVTVTGGTGSHTVLVHGNAFLYVAFRPGVAQHVTRISARTASGTVAVPFAPALVGFGFAAPSGHLTGPTAVQRHVVGGTIGWLVHERAVGQPLSALSARTKSQVERHTVYGRIIKPDPSLPYRVAITLSTSRHGGKATGLCTWQIQPNGGAGGGCAVRADVFATGPITGGTGSFDGSSEFATLTGLASDDVARITAFLANGQTQPVALEDNVYIVELPRAGLPARLVAYDRKERIVGLRPVLVGLTRLSGGGVGPAPGRPKLIGHVDTASGGFAELYVGPATNGGTCTYVRWRASAHAGGVTEGCAGAGTAPRAARLFLEPMGNPIDVVTGRLPVRTASVVLRYRDGRRAIVEPADGRYVIYAVPQGHLTAAHRLVGAAALDATGKQLAAETFPYRPPKR